MNRLRRWHGVASYGLVFALLVILIPSAVATAAVSSQPTGPGTPAAGATIPQSPLGEQLTWLLGVLNSGAKQLTPAEIEQHVSPAMLAQVPTAQLIAVAKQLAAFAPFTVEGFVSSPTTTQGVALVASHAGPRFNVTIAVEATKPYRLTALLFQPESAPGATPVVGSAIPNTPVGQQLAWLLNVLNGGINTLTPKEAQSHLSGGFQALVSPDRFVISLQLLFVQGQIVPPVTLNGFARTPTATEAIALLTTRDAHPFEIPIEVEPNPPHAITSVAIRPRRPGAGAPGGPVASPAASPVAAEAIPAASPVAVQSWDQLDRQVEAQAPETGLLAAEVVNGQCQTVHALNASEPRALGSEFKLYVLGELVHQVQEGKLSWDQPLAIRDDWKSLPSGFMQNQPAGTTFPLSYYAEEMIAVSDNTATDHLIHLLGQDNVEAYQTAMGNTHAALNNPFLTTREMFALKLAVAPYQTAAYINASPVERRQLLSSVVDQAQLSVEQALGWTNPAFIGQIEWFASPSDICRAFATLQSLSEQPKLAPLKQILSLNPGVAFDPRTWPYVAYKGGSENGVLTLGWLLQRGDGRWFVLSMMYNNPTAPITETPAVLLAGPAVDLLAKAK